MARTFKGFGTPSPTEQQIRLTPSGFGKFAAWSALGRMDGNDPDVAARNAVNLLVRDGWTPVDAQALMDDAKQGAPGAEDRLINSLTLAAHLMADLQMGDA